MKMDHGVKVSRKDFDVLSLKYKAPSGLRPKSESKNVVCVLAWIYLLGAKKQVERYRQATLLLGSQPEMATMDCYHEASNLFEDLNTIRLYMDKCGNNHKYHDRWKKVRDHIRHTIWDDLNIENKRKRSVANDLGLELELQLKVGFSMEAIKVGETVIEIREIEKYLLFVENVIGEVLGKAKT